MSELKKANVSVGSGIIATYQRMTQKLERVFSEFIDNSFQSFKDHKDILEKLKINNCKIDIVWNDNEIAITDNAFGMDENDFRRALKLNAPKSNYSDNSRSKYGMGLKIAAAYLGNWYSIETTQYGIGEIYKGIVDIEYWKNNNPTTIDIIINEIKENQHFTKITIKNISKKLTKSIDEELRKKLSVIYKSDIDCGDLELYLNGIPIISTDPELRKNSETGSDYYASFENEFEFNNQVYKYYGWLGILQTSSTSDAGFVINQNGRGILLNYRPEKVFKKANGFIYQRIVGEIELDKSWKVSFNKDSFIWDNGLEEIFLESLLSIQEVSNMIDIATKLRKITSTIDQKTLSKNAKNIENKFSKLKKVNKTNIVDVIESNVPKMIINNEVAKKSEIIPITYEGINYEFEILLEENDINRNWFTLQTKCPDKNAYFIVLNALCPYFNDINKKNNQELIISFAVTLALSQLSSVRLGLSKTDSALFLNQLNNIIKNIC